MRKRPATNPGLDAVGPSKGAPQALASCLRKAAKELRRAGSCRCRIAPSDNPAVPGLRAPVQPQKARQYVSKVARPLGIFLLDIHRKNARLMTKIQAGCCDFGSESR